MYAIRSYYVILFALLRKERILTLRKYESISLNKNEIDFLYEKIIHELQFNKGYVITSYSIHYTKLYERATPVLSARAVRPTR